MEVYCYEPLMRVLLATWGSYGDFFPFLSLAKELRRRGHEVTLVGNPEWEEQSRKQGIRYRASFLHEGENPLLRYPEIIDRKWLGLPCLNHLMNKAILPILPSTFETILEEAAQHDLLVAHHFVFPAGMVWEKTGIPWVTVCLAPSVSSSAWHQSAASFAPQPKNAVQRGTASFAWYVGKFLIGALVDPPLNKFRTINGLNKRSNHFFASRSSELTLHLYSKLFSPKPADWDGTQFIAGFCYVDGGRDFSPSAELASFLEQGPKPWLFTLGTTIVEHPRKFFREAAAAAINSGARAILLTGKPENVPENLPDSILALDYCPHDWLMPRCAAVAHQCGVGTSAEALRAGIPSVGCPHAFDQPNNATLLRSLGVATILKDHEIAAPRMGKAFRSLLNSEASEQARRLAQGIRNEDGSGNAAQALEQYYLSKNCP